MMTLHADSFLHKIEAVNEFAALFVCEGCVSCTALLFGCHHPACFRCLPASAHLLSMNGPLRTFVALDDTLRWCDTAPRASCSELQS